MEREDKIAAIVEILERERFLGWLNSQPEMDRNDADRARARMRYIRALDLIQFMRELR